MADDRGRFFVHVSPDYGVNVRAEDAGLGEAQRQLAPAEVALGGPVALELPGHATRPASLTLHFDGTAEQLGRFAAPQIEAFDLATWSDVDVAAVLGSTLPWDAQSAPSRALPLHFESQGQTEERWNAWTFSRLRPGRYLVRTRRAMPNEGPHGFALGTAFVVELGEGQAVHETWHAELGGRVRFEVTASGAEIPSFRAAFHAADGERLPVQFHDPRGVGSYRSSLVDTGTFELIPALPAGAYTLELRTKGRGLRSIPVHVDAGRTTDVRVDLSTL